MSYIYKCYSKLLLQSFQFHLHLLSKLKVKSPKGFIKKQHLGIIYKSSCNCNSLFLTSGKCIRLPVFISIKLDEVQHFINSFCDFIFWSFSDFKPISYVIKYCHVRKESIVLKDCIYISFKRFLIFNTYSLNLDSSAGSFLKTSNHSKCCGFPAS
ncbi:hypothetical protein SDC9_82651 [bioreactor metagenome]|uniref:Uncharacterized protein n=1 Tax=bioreactor metagenome TaxID=1076179 RepID=A0A644Z5B5_9ZZZZ